MTEHITPPKTETKTIKTAPEIKSGAGDAAAAFAEFNRAFSAFRETNDERLGQIETRLSGDVITEEKLARIDRALDETRRRMDTISVERARPKLGLDVKAPPQPTANASLRLSRTRRF